ncbi:MAG: hypothetical protein U1E97_00995 [Alphaproteobacteria bacterium]
MVPSIPPFYEIIGRGDPATKLSDLKGKRIRALGGTGAALRKLGVVPTSMVTPETAAAWTADCWTARRSRTLSLAPISSRKSPTGTRPTCGWHGPPPEISVNKQAYDALPPQYKKLLKDLVAGPA